MSIPPSTKDAAYPCHVFMKVSYPKVTLKNGEHPWVTYSKRLISTDNDCINLFTVGKPGTGKSWGTLSYLEQIYPDFDIDAQCFWRGEDIVKKIGYLINMIESGTKATMEDRIFMFDESGIDLYNLKWRDNINTSINHFFQTCRSLNYLCAMTVPYLSFVSKPVRKLMTHKFTATGWDKGMTKFSCLRHDWNDEKEKSYWKRLRVYDKDIGLTIPCNRVNFPKPSDHLLIPYERKKKKFQKQIQKELEEVMEQQKQKQESKQMIRCSKVARDLGLGRGTMLQWIEKGVVNARKIQGSWLMTSEEHERLLNEPNSLEKTQNERN